jgi:DUF971 family protein
VLQVPTITASSNGEELTLRYYTASHTKEYTIPAAELRARDPVTGKIRAEAGATAEGTVEKYRVVQAVKFDHKGQYGVAVVWSDGHYADIFPYDVLRSIAEELATQKRLK